MVASFMTGRLLIGMLLPGRDRKYSGLVGQAADEQSSSSGNAILRAVCCTNVDKVCTVKNPQSWEEANDECARSGPRSK